MTSYAEPINKGREIQIRHGRTKSKPSLHQRGVVSPVTSELFRVAPITPQMQDTPIGRYLRKRQHDTDSTGGESFDIVFDTNGTYAADHWSGRSGSRQFAGGPMVVYNVRRGIAHFIWRCEGAIPIFAPNFRSEIVGWHSSIGYRMWEVT